MPQSFSGQNLRDRSFKDLNLTGTDFSDADLRSTNFTRAILVGANFQNARTGVSYSRAVGLIIGLLLFSIVSGFCFGFLTYLISLIFDFENYANMSAGWLACCALIIFVLATLRQGLNGGLIAFAISYSVAAVIAFIIAFSVNDPNTFTFAGAGAGAVLSTIASAIAVAGIYIITNSLKLGITIVSIGGILGIYAGALSCDFAFKGDGIILFALMTALLSIPFEVYLGWQALQGDSKYTFIRTFAIAFSSLGGTQFCHANLTDSDFFQATLKCANFRNANLNRTNFHRAKKLDRTRVGNTILSNSRVRDLLVTHRGANQSYIGCNLKGANLENADLSDADLTAAELDNATLVGALLDRSNLTQVQALGTNFRGANLTGACLEAWNIDNTTQLDGIICDYVYLQGNQRERRPSSGEFRSGEFTKLFQVALNTVDLIFRNGLDLQAFSTSLQKVKIENPNLDLELQSIENKEDGIVIVKVRVPEETDKAQIHADLTQNYHQAVKALEERYRAELQAKDAQIEVYRQQQDDWKELAKLLASGHNSNPEKLEKNYAVNGKWVILKVGQGSFDRGFPVTLQVGEEGQVPSIECSGEFSPEPNLPESYRQLRSSYCRRTDALFRIEVFDTQVTNFSFREVVDDCDRLAKVFQSRLNLWLNSEAFRPIKERILETLNPTDCIRIILQTSNPELRQLPWYAWEFFDRYSKAEIAISTPAYERVKAKKEIKNRVKVLSILGNSRGIDVNGDRQILEKLPNSDVTFLVEPQRQELNDRLWERAWDILFFAGHSASSTDGTTGQLAINPRDRLTISQLKHGLKKAIDRGLKLAIFNSCAGLGLAANLADLQIPQIIVMREPVSDRVAQAFLKHFLLAFSRGTSLYLSVREAREQLQGLEDEFPGATWLPVLCQNPAVSPGTWEYFRGR